MTWLRLALANLRHTPLRSAINILLMALGTLSIVVLLLIGAQLTDRLSKDARGVDLVLGATGSPVQLILAAVYHADVPPGNVSLAAAQRWMNDSRVAAAVPLAIGDSHRGFRIVGTSLAFFDFYQASPQSGRLWQQPMEAVIGAAVAEQSRLAIGDRFAGVHGLSSGGHGHDQQSYVVTGILAPTGTITDRLILTALQSVWDLHAPAANHADEHANESHPETHDEHEEGVEEDEHHVAHAPPASHDAEITAVLLRYRTPLAALTLPREINATGQLQAAAPAVQIARILSLLGIGIDGLRAFAWALVATAALSVFAALYGSLHARRMDIALLRCLGASRWELLLCLILEGLLLSGIGVMLGLVAAHGLTELLGLWLIQQQGVGLTGWIWLQAETLLLLGLTAIGGIAAALPAIQAYRTDVAKTLAEA